MSTIEIRDTTPGWREPTILETRPVGKAPSSTRRAADILIREKLDRADNFYADDGGLRVRAFLVRDGKPELDCTIALLRLEGSMLPRRQRVPGEDVWSHSGKGIAERVAELDRD